MTDLLTQHIAIVKRELTRGVTDRADLIDAVTEWHRACKDWLWSENGSAMMVDVALAEIERMKKNEIGTS